jgi:transposase
MRVYSDATRAQVASDFAAGMSRADITKKHGVSTSTIRSIFLEFNIPPRQPRKKKYQEGSETEALLDDIRADRAAGLTYNQIIAKRKVNSHVIRQAIHGEKSVSEKKPEPSEDMEKALDRSIEESRRLIRMMDRRRAMRLQEMSEFDPREMRA